MHEDRTPDRRRKLGRAVTTALAENPLGALADLLGALGLFGFCYATLTFFFGDRILGLSAGWWTGIIGVLLVALYVGVLVYNAQKSVLRENASLRKRLLELAEPRGSREVQRQAVEAASLIYGYRIARRKEQFTIYRDDGKQDGSARCYQEIVFRANRRAVASWWRSVKSSLVKQFNGSDQVRITSLSTERPTHFEVEAISTSDRPHVLIEEFRFTPTIQSIHGDVALSLEDDYPGGTFLTKRPNQVNRTFDFISVSPREPVELLEIQVEFDGFRPGNVRIETYYGDPPKQPLAREQVDAEELLSFDQLGSKFIALLQLPYPVMGVVYKLIWELREELPQSAEGAGLQTQQ